MTVINCGSLHNSTVFPSLVFLHYHIDIPLAWYQYCTEVSDIVYSSGQFMVIMGY
jgi:hypothetical protein